MTQELWSGQSDPTDPNRKTFHKIRIWINGADYALKYVVWALTSFEMAANATPGTGTLVLKDPLRKLDFQGGEVVKVEIDDERVYTGFVFGIGRGYWFGDYVGTQKVSGRRWDLSIVDLNILLDKLYSYNHTNPTTFPNGGGTFPGGVVPVGTTDRQYIIGALKDFDIGLTKYPINTTARVKETAVIVAGPDKGQLMGAGAVLRAVIADAAGNANKAALGSMVWYIDPKGYLVYTALDNNIAPFAVTDDPIVNPGVAIRDLRLGSQIGSIKDDVLIFATELNPDPNSKQTQFRFKHQINTASVAKYGRFQYAETMPGFLQDSVNARAVKIITQEGTPAQSATFKCFRPGLYPGQIVTIWSRAWNWHANLPIRSIVLTFLSTTFAQWDVTASFDTQDPWGLIMALRRPASRGFIPARFSAVKLNPGDPVPARPTYTYVTEQPKPLGGNVYQCSYGYIRYSIAVHVGGLRAISKDGGSEGSELFFWETSPQKGQFKLLSGASGPILVQYHVANNL